MLVVGSASAARADVATATVTYEVYNFYNPSEPIFDAFRVTAHNNDTGASFDADRDATFQLPAGNYTFSGRSQWCYLQPKTVDIDADTTDVTLLAGCE